MKKVIIPLIILIVVAAIVFFSVKAVKKRAAAKELANVPTVEVTYGSIEDKVLATGTITPFNRVEIKPSVNGTIEELKVDEGNRVRKDEVLGLLSSQDRTSIIEAAQEDLTEAKKSGDNDKIAEAQKSYEMVQDFYKPVPITSPISGEVVLREVQPGQIVNTSTGLLVLSDTLVATVQVDEADIRNISLGKVATVTLDAFPDQEIMGKVVKIAHESKVVSNVTIYEVQVRPDSIPADWRSGMTANVEFSINEKDSVLILPISVVREGTGSRRAKKQGTEAIAPVDTSKRSKYVMLLENGKEVRRRVKTGIDDGTNIEITEGLKEGDKVIYKLGNTSTQSQTQSGSPIPRMGGMGGFGGR